jgi:predicted transcriptional regulator
MNKKIVHVDKNDKISKAMELMRKFGYSQLPVFYRNQPIGSISEKTILDLISKGKSLKELSDEKIGSVIDESFPRISEDTPISAISSLLQYHSAVLVTKKYKTVGIITKSDLLKIPGKL